MTYTLVCVEPRRVREVLPMVHEMLGDAYHYGEAEVPPIEMFNSGNVLLWIAWGEEGKILAAANTQLVRSKAGLSCKLTAVAGLAFDRWRSALGRIEQYARDEGCYRLTFEGRLGWERLLPEFRRVAVIMEKRI